MEGGGLLSAVHLNLGGCWGSSLFTRNAVGRRERKTEERVLEVLAVPTMMMNALHCSIEKHSSSQLTTHCCKRTQSSSPMFRKPQDVLLSTQTSVRKKEVKEIRQMIRLSLANYTEEDDHTLFGSGNV